MIRFTKEVAQRFLGDVPQDKSFWCHDGRYLRSLAELKAALNDMSEDTFRIHCNDTTSDFSNWVRDVIGDEKLGRDLKKSTTKLQALKSVASRIEWLEDRL
ncbi:MAG: hypothetical protein Q8P44_01025 [Dehalococcoidia bacterium]|nr:hypothetical protein [Dehalococcoidia bacterium]